ncbi:Ser-Thr-rich GPI-anchored membrane family protein [Candidatus Neomarinimicrobiota bacterium]
MGKNKHFNILFFFGLVFFFVFQSCSLFDNEQNTMKMTFPESGTKCEIGKSVTIRWETDDRIDEVLIELITKSLSPLTIADNALNTGEYEWSIPANFPYGNDFSIRISDVDDPEDYTISEPPFILFKYIEFNDANLVEQIKTHVNDNGKISTYELVQLSIFSVEQVNDLTGMEYCDSLYAFSIKDSDLNDLNPISNLDKLVNLFLDNLTVVNASSLSNLTELTYFQLSNSNLQDLEFLSHMTQLRGLNIRHNPINNLDPIVNLVNLRFLDLTLCKIPDITKIGELKNLEKLLLQNVKPDNIDALAELSKLKYIDLSRNELTNINALENLVNIDTVNLSHNYYYGISLRPLVNNLGLNTGDVLYFMGNFIYSPTVDIATLLNRGVRVIFSPSTFD